jgi:hypothetical protein
VKLRFQRLSGLSGPISASAEVKRRNIVPKAELIDASLVNFLGVGENSA